MTLRRVWASLGIRPESVWNPLTVQRTVHLQTGRSSCEHPGYLQSIVFVIDYNINIFALHTEWIQ